MGFVPFNRVSPNLPHRVDRLFDLKLELAINRDRFARFCESLKDGPVTLPGDERFGNIDPEVFTNPHYVMQRYDPLPLDSIPIRDLTRAVQMALLANMDLVAQEGLSKKFRTLVVDLAKRTALLETCHHLNFRAENFFGRLMRRAHNTPEKASLVTKFADGWDEIANHPDLELLSAKDRHVLRSFFDRVAAISRGDLYDITSRNNISTPSETNFARPPVGLTD